MGKLNYEIIDKLKNCTSIEIDLVIYLANNSNEFGSCRDLYYKDICLDLNISKQSFYNALYSIESKNLILIDNYSKKINVQLINNIYNNKSTYKKGYINVNFDFLKSKEFKNLKGNEKKLILVILRGYRNNRYKIKIKNLQNKLNLQTSWYLKGYFESIKKWFDINIHNGVVTIKKLEETQNSSHGEEENNFIYKLKSFCRRYNIAYTINSLEDTIVLFRRFIKDKKDTFFKSFNSLLRYNILQPRLINHIVTNTYASEDQEQKSDFYDSVKFVANSKIE